MDRELHILTLWLQEQGRSTEEKVLIKQFILRHINFCYVLMVWLSLIPDSVATNVLLFEYRD